MRTTAIIFVLLFVSMMSCKSNQQVADKALDEIGNKIAEGDIIPMTSLESGTYSGYEEPKQLLITSEEEWANTWKLLNRYKSPVPSLPEVDFNKKSIIGVFMGMKNSGGFGIRIEEIRESGDSLNVKVIHHKPGNNCITTAALTQPYHLVTVDSARIKEAAFSVEEKINDCE